MLGFLQSKPKIRTEFDLKKPGDVYTILHYLDTTHASDALRFVVNELTANILEHDEQAKIYIRDHIIHALIDKKTLNDEKIFRIKLAILLTAKFHTQSGELRLSESKYGGLGMKSIYNLGYDMAYEESEDSFSIVVYKHEQKKIA